MVFCEIFCKNNKKCEIEASFVSLSFQNVVPMRRYCLFLIMMCLSVTMMAQKAWTVETVPNTRLQSNDIHVSDPDGYLSDSTEMTINTALCAIRDKADVFVVTLSSIGNAEPKHFATELLNYWGIGDAATNNGVLLLFIEDQHALETETGYGVEETLTDAKCERIFTNAMAPYFRAGDYEGGLCSGVAEIVTVFGGEIPMGLVTTLPSQTDNGADDDLDDVGNYLWLGVFGLFMFVMPFVGLAFWAKKRGESKRKGTASGAYRSYQESGVTYVDGFKTSWSGSPWEGKGCLGGMMLGLSMFVIMFFVIIVMIALYPDVEESKLYGRIALITLVLYLTWMCFRHNHRVLKTAKQLSATSINPKSVYQTAFNRTSNKIAIWMAPWLGWIYYLILKKKVEQSDDCRCPSCGGMMRKDGMFSLPENHLAENRAEALKFTPYRCANGHVIVVKEHGRHYNKFSTCSKCGAYTLKLIKTETVREADYSNSGEKVETYECQHCGDIVTKTVVIPKLVHYSSGGGSYSSGSSSGRSYSSHSSSRSGGSFGGGRSGGGGHSGRW